MNLLAPYMLWGAAAAGIPIALHFFFRSRYRTIPWAAMKFLLMSIEQTSRRLRFQELLLLLARVAMLALLALALARPITAVGGGAGRGEAVDAVLLIDTSYSMAAQDGAATRLERARKAAVNVIDQLPPHSTVQIVTCSDRATLAGPRSPSALDQARGIAEETRFDHVASDLLPGLQESAAALQRGQASNREFYLLSDMQKLGWEQQGGAVVQSLKDLKEKATIYMVRCGRSKAKNVAVVGIAPQSGVPRPGERVGFAVLVRNSGSETVKDLKVSLMIDGDAKSRETQALDSIGAGEMRAITLTGKLEKPGLRVLTAQVEIDDLDADNRFDQVINVREHVNVLIVDGAAQPRDPAKSASFFLEHALVPVKDESERLKYYLQVHNVSPRLAVPGRLAKQDLCILVNVPLEDAKRGETVSAEFLEELARFVRQGRGLMIFAGDNVTPDAYNRLLGEKHKLLPLAIKGVKSQPAKQPLAIDRESVSLPAFAKFKEDDRFKGIGFVSISRSLELDERGTRWEKKDDSEKPVVLKKKDEQAKVVLRYNTAMPMVATRKVGSGEVMQFATSADPGWKPKDPNPTWNDWPLAPELMYLPFMDMAVSYLLHGQTQNHNLVAGTKLSWHPQEKDTKAYTLVHPDGRAERLGVPVDVDGKKVVTAKDLRQAGVYRLVAAVPPTGSSAEPTSEQSSQGEGSPNGTPPDEIPLAVVPDLRESEDLEALSDEQIDERLGFRPIHVTAGDSPVTFSEIERLNREWTLWLLLGVLGLALGESLLAWWCGRAR
ncbi:MAG: VWA domain-containing protein [Planctomycetes bacterium]|nr:VWA domain-containing protein [Planctomycetota bacterium]